MVKGDPTMVFLVALTKRAVAVMALRQGGYPHDTGSSSWLYYSMGQWWPPCLWMSIPRAFFSVPHMKGNLIIEMLNGSLVH